MGGSGADRELFELERARAPDGQGVFDREHVLLKRSVLVFALALC